MGVVYLIQPPELKGTDRYKVGCSHDDGVSRITNGYNRTTTTFLVEHVDDPFEVETRIVRTFAERFHRLQGGREYFAGNILDMIACFRDIVIAVFNDKVVRENPPPIQVEEVVDDGEEDKSSLKSRKVIPCPKCNKKFTRKDSMRYHERTCRGPINPRQCQICLKTFTTTHGRVRHNRHVICTPPTTPE